MFRIICLLFLLPVHLYAQDSLDSILPIPRYDIIGEIQQTSPAGGKVLLTTTPSIDNLLEWHIRQNERKKTFSGYRIQIYSVNSFGCDINQLKEMRDKFEQTFPDLPAYLRYFDPDFKIRVGNFRSRLECIPALRRIRRLYPSSYPVKTEISLEELERIPMQDLPKEENSEETNENGFPSGEL